MVQRGDLKVRVLTVSMASVMLAFVIHWFVWRIRIPQRQSATLLAIFSATLLLGIATSRWWPVAWRFTSPWEVLHVASFHVAAMLAYVVAYSALEERSPSMTMLTRVADAGSSGLSREQVESSLMHVSPVETRLAAMLRDRMLLEEGDRFVLTAKGRAWVGTFSGWRRMLGFRMGG